MEGRHTRNIAGHISLALVVVAGGLLFIPQSTSAATAVALSGYAWSSNIGWISFSGANYGVVEDTATGNLSGYAWSSNIGWISFNQTSGCPESGCTTKPNINPTTGVVSGWAQALSADGNGWDGWIKLGGSWSPAVKFTSGAASGYSWGSDVVGWISWSGTGYGVTMPVVPPTCTAFWNPASITAGGVATLYWTVTPQATIQSSYSCTGISAETGNVRMLRSHAFRFYTGGTETCTVSTVRTSDGATASCQTLVPLTVNQVCLSGAQDNNCYIHSGVHVVSSSPVTGTCIRGTAKTLGTHSCAYVCTADPNSTNGKWVLSSNACMGSAPSNPTAYITASPTRVQNGNSTTLSWSASGVTSCSVTGPGGTTISNTFSNTATTTQSVTVTGQSKYTLSCDGGAASSSVIVNVVPKYNEF